METCELLLRGSSQFWQRLSDAGLACSYRFVDMRIQECKTWDGHLAPLVMLSVLLRDEDDHRQGPCVMIRPHMGRSRRIGD